MKKGGATLSLYSALSLCSPGSFSLEPCAPAFPWTSKKSGLPQRSCRAWVPMVVSKINISGGAETALVVLIPTAVVGLFLLLAFLSQLLRWRECRALAVPEQQAHDIRDLVAATVSEAFATLLLILLYPVGFVVPLKGRPAGGAGGPRPVIFLHGYLHNQSAFFFFGAG